MEVNVDEAKAHFSTLLTLVKKGQRIVISRNGEPVADLAPHVPQPTDRRKKRDLSPDPFLSKIQIDYDPTEGIGYKAWPKENR